MVVGASVGAFAWALAMLVMTLGSWDHERLGAFHRWLFGSFDGGWPSFWGTVPGFAGLLWLIRRIGPCTLVPVEREPYEALVRAIAHQQVHGRAAEAILGRFLALHPEGRFPAPLGQWQDWHDTIAPPENRLPGDHRTGRGQPNPSRRAAAGEAAEAGGKPAHVRARVVRRAGEVSLVELEPSTGRRHQLRQQLSRRRCPIVGDRRYGSRIPLADGVIALHASGLSFDHPATGERLSLEAPGPAEWRERFPAIFASRYR
jgi:hypothetical protein